MSTTASLVTAFNLLCTVYTSGLGGVPTMEENNKQYVFVIDLAAGRFCYEKCFETKPISRVTEQTIFLISKTENPASESLWMNRESGRLDWEFGEGKYQTVRMGRCEKQPFTGFPERKF